MRFTRLLALLLAGALILAGCSKSPSRDNTPQPGHFGDDETTTPSAVSPDDEAKESAASAETDEAEDASSTDNEEKSSSDIEDDSSSGTGGASSTTPAEDNDSSPATPEASEDESMDTDPSDDPGMYSGDLYNTGLFQAFCPDGWDNFPVKDFWEADKLDETALQFVKGKLKNDFDFYYHASIRMTCYGPDVYLMDSRDYYEDVEDMELEDFSGRIWDGYTGNYGDDRNFYLHTQDEKHHYVVTGLLEARDSSITLADNDVLLILSSIIGNDVVPGEEPPSHSGTKDTETEEPTTAIRPTETDAIASVTASADEPDAVSTTASDDVTTIPGTSDPTISTSDTETSASPADTSDPGTMAPDTDTSSSEADTSDPTGPDEPEHVFHAADAVEITYDHTTETMTAIFHTLPERLEDVAALVEEFGLGEHNMAIWFVCAMHLYQEDPLEAVKIMTALSDEPSANHLVSFVTDQLKEKPYLGTAYFKGAVKDNDFTPEEPLTVTVSKTSGSDPRYLYIRVHTDADSRERTIAFMDDGRIAPSIAALPSLVLGIY